MPFDSGFQTSDFDVDAVAPSPVDAYLARVTPEHADKPNFMAVVAMLVQPFVDAQEFLASLPAAFDLDSAIGVQLDATGLRIGLTRYIRAPLTNQYFSWSDPLRGWGRGIWFDPHYGNEYGVTALDDETFRRLLRAKILANQWDGTLPGLREIVNTFFDSPNLTLAIVQDDSTDAGQNTYFAWSDPAAGWAGGYTSGFGTGFDAEFETSTLLSGGSAQWFVPGDTIATIPAVGIGLTIGISGRLPPLPLLFLLEQQLVPTKAIGAPVRYAFTSIDSRPLFGWGVDNQYISGWGAGAWGVDAQSILDAPPSSVYSVTEAA